jgi:hypothetical protein
MAAMPAPTIAIVLLAAVACARRTAIRCSAYADRMLVRMGRAAERREARRVTRAVLRLARLP